MVKKRLLSLALAFAIVLGLIPTFAFAQNEGEDNAAETNGILIGADWNNGTWTAKLSESVQYSITSNGDDTYTLTFSGSGEIPDYYIETQGYAENGTAIYKEGNEWKDSEGNVIEGGPKNNSGDYRYCTSDRVYYQLTQWNQFDEKEKITKVVFESGIEKIGRYTLFSMAGVTSVVIENPECKVSDNAIYYNGVNAPACTITRASTVGWKSNSVNYL